DEVRKENENVSNDAENILNYNASFINKNKILKSIVEYKFYEKIVKNVKLIVKSIIKLKNKVENVYLLIKFASSKCILKMSTFYYLKYIIEQIYQKKLEKLVRVVLPISDLHKLYSYIYFQNFSITNYYEHTLSKSTLNELKIHYGSFIILNKHSKTVTQVYEKIYGLDFINLCDEKCRSKKKKKQTTHNIINANNNNTSININEVSKTCENSNIQNMKNCKELKQEEIKDSCIKINTKTRHTLKCVKMTKGGCRNKYKKGTGIKIENVVPFIKIKNSHTILYQIAMKNNKNKPEEISESHRDKYRKYISNSYYINSSKYNQEKETSFISQSTNLLKKKCQSLIKTNIEKLYQNEKWKGNKLLCSNRYKKKIFNYLQFHINYNKNKSEKKIIVLKRIHDPFSFSLDIQDLFCLTMSKESEANGYNIAQRRRLIFQKNKTSLTKNEQIEHNLQIAIDSNNRSRGNDIEKIKTCLNIFDTINISSREKMSSTLIRMENSTYRKGKFSKYLKYFIEACLYFNIDHFLTQMHADIFLKKSG
ncbi:phosphopantetheine adenylyltransferase, putative (PPAT), partial [Plasmodium ovale curtisi]